MTARCKASAPIAASAASSRSRSRTTASNLRSRVAAPSESTAGPTACPSGTSASASCHARRPSRASTWATRWNAPTPSSGHLYAVKMTCAQSPRRLSPQGRRPAVAGWHNPTDSNRSDYALAVAPGHRRHRVGPGRRLARRADRRALPARRGARHARRARRPRRRRQAAARRPGAAGGAPTRNFWCRAAPRTKRRRREERPARCQGCPGQAKRPGGGPGHP